MKKSSSGSAGKKPIEFFVAPWGNDLWSGKRPEKAGGRNGPFATIERAQQAVRALKRKGALKAPVNVYLRGGVYELRKPLRFGPQDAGEVLRPVTYRAYGDETPVISGGTVIRGFREDKLNGRRVWVAKVRKGWDFRQLFANGLRRPRTRLPENGYFRIAKVPGVTPKMHSHAGQDTCIVRKGDIKPWKNMSDVEVVLFHFWIDERFGIRSFSPRTGKLVFDRKSRMRLTIDHRAQGAQYYVENVFEAMKKPGQWYLDKSTRTLYYLPVRGEKLEECELVAPRLLELAVVAGTGKKKVEHLHFRGLTFSHTRWELPPDLSSYSQAASAASSAIRFSNAEICSLSDCALEHLGSYAVELAEGCRDIELRRNRITDLGGGGVKVEDGNERTTIADNEIAHGGRVYHAGVGILVKDSGANKIVHNHVHDFYYTGISVGWKWGYMPSRSFGNIIEYNHIHDIGQGVLTDMGGIYTLGVSTGSRIRFNLIHDVDSRSYGGWGIYLDEGSTDFLVEKNIVYRTKHSGFFQHYGKNNIVRNNIFAFARENQIGRGRVERHISFTYCRNIVYFDSGPNMFFGNHVFVKTTRNDIKVLTAAHKRLKAANVVFHDNLYCNKSRRKLVFDCMTAAEWKKLGHDAGTIVADALFLNPQKGDFSLKPNSPAFKIGFEPFDLSTAGPRAGKAAFEDDILRWEVYVT